MLHRIIPVPADEENQSIREDLIQRCKDLKTELESMKHENKSLETKKKNAAGVCVCVCV